MGTDLCPTCSAAFKLLAIMHATVSAASHKKFLQAASLSRMLLCDVTDCNMHGISDQVTFMMPSQSSSHSSESASDSSVRSSVSCDIMVPSSLPMSELSSSVSPEASDSSSEFSVNSSTSYKRIIGPSTLSSAFGSGCVDGSWW